MISPPLRPSSTMRVGATRRSPTPASAAVGKATSGAANALAASMDLVHMFITAIPTALRNGAIVTVLIRNGLFSVNHDDLPRQSVGSGCSIVDGDVECAAVGARGRRRAEGDRTADREVGAGNPRRSQQNRGRRI